MGAWASGGCSERENPLGIETDKSKAITVKDGGCCSERENPLGIETALFLSRLRPVGSCSERENPLGIETIIHRSGI